LISFTIPGVLKSEPNQRGGWKTKHFGRTAPARRKAMTLCPVWKLGPLLVVHLVRYGVKELDDDNLQGAFKATRDGIASRLGIDDQSKLITWTYDQKTCAKGEERVEVTMTPRYHQAVFTVQASPQEAPPWMPRVEVSPQFTPDFSIKGGGSK
jgi:hypothetical protein